MDAADPPPPPGPSARDERIAKVSAMIEKIVGGDAVPAPISKDLKTTLILVRYALQLRRSQWNALSEADLEWLEERLREADVATAALVDEHMVVTRETAARLRGSLARFKRCAAKLHKNTSGVSVPIEQCAAALLRDAHAAMTESGLAELANSHLLDSLPEIDVLRQFVTHEGHTALLVAVVPQNADGHTADAHDSAFLDAAERLAATAPLHERAEHCAALFSDHETGVAALTRDDLGAFGGVVHGGRVAQVPITRAHALLRSMFGDRVHD